MFYLVGIAGENGVGKTTLAKQITEFSDILKTHCIKESFATPIRNAAVLLGFSIKYGNKDTDTLQLYANEVYNTLFKVLTSGLCCLDYQVAHQYALSTVVALGGKSFLYGGNPMLKECTCREFMITFGETCKKFNKNIWLEALLDRVLGLQLKDVIVVLDDVRFLNEARMCDKVIHLYDSSNKDRFAVTSKEFEERMDLHLDVNDPALLEKVFDLLEYKLV